MEKSEILNMLYQACCLYSDQVGGKVPDWVQIIVNGDPGSLEDVAEIARDDMRYEEEHGNEE